MRFSFQVLTKRYDSIANNSQNPKMKTNIHIPMKIIRIIFSRIFHCILLRKHSKSTVCVCGLWYQTELFETEKLTAVSKISLLPSKWYRLQEFKLKSIVKKIEWTMFGLVWLCKEVSNQNKFYRCLYSNILIALCIFFQSENFLDCHLPNLVFE